MSYDIFCEYYDDLMRDANYKERAEYLAALFSKYDSKPTLLLDLACGTGSFSIEFAKMDIEVVGVDSCVGMLSIARQKAAQEGLDILLLCQSAAELELYGTVDGAICCMDSINHITDYEELCSSLKKVALYLEKGRLFIFDANTVYKHEKVLAGSCYIKENDKCLCIWQNELVENNTINISLDFFVKKQESTYERYNESFCERAYSEDQIKNALESAGLRIIDALGEMSFSKADKFEERIFYITERM